MQRNWFDRVFSTMFRITDLWFAFKHLAIYNVLLCALNEKYSHLLLRRGILHSTKRQLSLKLKEVIVFCLSPLVKLRAANFKLICWNSNAESSQAIFLSNQKWTYVRTKLIVFRLTHLLWRKQSFLQCLQENAT